MKTLRLDGRMMASRALAHAYLKKRLHLPDYYGHNLDALHDCLAEMGEPTHLVLLHLDDCMSSLGEYGHMLLTVFQQAAEENPNLVFSFSGAPKDNHDEMNRT